MKKIKTYLVLASSLAMIVLLSGCTREVVKWSSEEAAKLTQVELVSHQITIRLALGQPSLISEKELGDFLKTIGAGKNAEVWILSPDQTSADSVAQMLEALGIGTSQIRFTPFSANTVDTAVTIRVDRFLLNLAKCTDWSNSNLLNASNRNSSNWGCSVDRNLALTLVNPRDLVRGRTLDAASGQTAVSAVRRYYTDKVKPLPESNTSNFLNK